MVGNLINTRTVHYIKHYSLILYNLGRLHLQYLTLEIQSGLMIIIIAVIPTPNYYTCIVTSRRLLYDLQKVKNNDYCESFGLSRTSHIKLFPENINFNVYDVITF